MADSAASEAPASGFLGGLAAKVVLVSFFMLALLVGAWVAGAGFHDPDTCWILALGKIIFEQKALPVTDPFSYTFAMPPAKQFLLYQWLTEVSLYAFYQLGGLMGILIAMGCVVHLSLIAVPLVTFDRIALSRMRSFGLIALGFSAAAFHLLIRPEIFSYLFLSLWMALLLLLRRKGEGALVDWRFVAAFAVIMTIWCNFHTGFTSGLIALFIYVLGSGLALAAGGTVNKPAACTAGAALVLSFLCTLINPYGVQLLQYIPHLYFGGFNKSIVEVQPLRLSDLKDPAWYPFILLTGITVKWFVRNVKSTGLFSGDRLASAVMIIVLVSVAVSVRRLVSFNALIMMYECAWLRSRMPSRADGFVAETNERLRSVFRIDFVSLSITLIVALTGVVMIATGPVKPRLPQPSVAFVYPDEAIEYMKKNPPAGHGFNSPHFGDVMIWNLDPCPKLFIDTRFDMYGAQLVEDYRTIVACKPGWQELLAKYRFDWVFVHASGPFADFIRSSPDWNVLINAKQALYAIRKGQE